MTAIRAVGAYAPRHRLDADAVSEAWGTGGPGGIETVAVPGADEDTLTMAVAAARRALSAGDVDPDVLSAVAFATSTPPDAEEDPTARLGSMLGLAEDTGRAAFTQSTRAGTRALRWATERADGPTLAVAADAPLGRPGEDEGRAAGAGAAALLLAPEGPATIEGWGEYAAAYPGTRFREPGSERVEGLGVTAYDRQAFRETLVGAVESLDADPDEATAAAVQAPDGALPYRVADDLGVDAERVAACETVSALGDTGAASVPLGLTVALADGHDHVLGAAHGSGAGADALLVDGGDVPADLALDGDAERSYAEALRLRGEITPGPPDGGGAYVSVPSWRRSLPQRHRLVAGRCEACGALAFPPEGACPDCGDRGDFEAVRLTGTGTVEAVTTISQGGAPPEFAEHQQRDGEYDVAVVALDGPDGGSVSAPLQVAGVDSGRLDVGDRVAATIRRIYTQEGVTRYGTKVRPAEE